MKAKKNLIRALGQRSLTSFCSLNRARDSEEEEEEKRDKKSKDPSISLSTFLNRKLQGTSVPPGTVQGKSRPFSSPVHLKDIINGQNTDEKGGEVKMKSDLDKTVFEQFKHTGVEGGDCVELDSSNVVQDRVDVGTSETGDLQDSRKRKNPFEGWDKKHAMRKSVVVLGGDPKAEHNTQEVAFVRNKKPRPIYNHYANGCGWWDNDMEGIDSAEVGSTEVWEGVGSTTSTFEGVIDWH